MTLVTSVSVANGFSWGGNFGRSLEGIGFGAASRDLDLSLRSDGGYVLSLWYISWYSRFTASQTQFTSITMLKSTNGCWLTAYSVELA